jgi:cytochrome c-type biogenesis protein CcmH/NrfG
MMGQIRYQKGNIEIAMANFKAALEIDGQRFNSLLSLGSLSQAQ